YWVTFNILGILQQLYINWSSKKEKLAVATGTGFQLEMEKETLEESNGGHNTLTKEKVAGREKGGKKVNGSPNSRKKGKKRG
ncbi:hypothetical protein, partial [Syntrophomonas wolfei]